MCRGRAFSTASAAPKAGTPTGTSCMESLCSQKRAEKRPGPGGTDSGSSSLFLCKAAAEQRSDDTDQAANGERGGALCPCRIQPLQIGQISREHVIAGPQSADHEQHAARADAPARMYLSQKPHPSCGTALARQPLGPQFCFRMTSSPNSRQATVTAAPMPTGIHWDWTARMGSSAAKAEVMGVTQPKATPNASQLVDL